MKKFLISCLAIFLIGEVSHKYHSAGLDFFALTEEQAWIDWGLKAFRDTGLSLFVGVSIFWSIWSYKTASNKRKAKWYIALSTALGLTLAISAGYLYLTYSDAIEHRKSVLISDNPLIMKAFSDYLNSPDYSLQEKHDNSLLHGSTVYMESGLKIQILDAQGNKVIYEPTPEDLVFRKKAEKLKVHEQHTKHSLKMAAYIWSILLFSSVFIGIAAIACRNDYHKQTP